MIKERLHITEFSKATIYIYIGSNGIVCVSLSSVWSIEVYKSLLGFSSGWRSKKKIAQDTESKKGLYILHLPEKMLQAPIVLYNICLGMTHVVKSEQERYWLYRRHSIIIQR